MDPYDYRDNPQYAYADYAEPRTAFDPFAGAVWVPDPPPPPAPAPAPVPYYGGQELYYQQLNFGPPPHEEEEQEEDERAALASYRTATTTSLTPTTAYQTATAAAEYPQHCPPPPFQYYYQQHFQRYPLAPSSEYASGTNDQQQYTHVDKRPRFDNEDAGAPGTFTSLSGYRAGGGSGDLSSSSYFHLPISSDPPPRQPIPVPTPISTADSARGGGGGGSDPRERAGPPLSHSASAGVRWSRQDPLLPPPPPQPGPSASHSERAYHHDVSEERGREGEAARAQQQQQQQRPSLASLSSGSNSTLGSATTTLSSSSSAFSALSSMSVSSIAPPNPNPNPPPPHQSGSPLAPPAPAPAATFTRPEQQQQSGPSSYTPQQRQRQMSVTVDHHHPGGTGEAIIIESEQVRTQSQNQQNREEGGGGHMSPSSQPAAVAHGQHPPPPPPNQSKKTQVSKSEKSCKACRIRKVRCSRTWPSCARCTEKRIDCHYGNLIPIDLVKGMHPDSRVAELEARIKMLEHELAARDGDYDAAASRPSTIAAGMFSSPMPPPALLTPRPSLGSSAPTPTPSSATSQKQSSNRAAPRLAETTDSFDLSCSSNLVQEEFGRTAYRALVKPVWEALVDPVDTKGVRKRHVDAVIASAEARAERLRDAKLLRGGHAHERGFGFEIEKDDSRYGAPGAAESEEDLFERMAREDLSRLQELKDLPIEELAHDPEWTRIAVWAVLDAHWATCSSNVPTLRPFHVPLRQARLHTRLNCLSPSERCIVLAFCAIGVRSTPDVGLLGLRGGPRIGKESAPNMDREEEEEEEHLGLKREMVARIYRELMIDMYGRLEVAYGAPNKDSLEASLILALVQMWNEFVPRYSRSLIRTAIAQYKELFENAAALAESKDVQAERTDLLMMYALPLLHIDSTTAAYLRAAPIITDADLATYFAPFKIPLFHHFDAKDGPGWLDLREEMRPWMDVDRIGDASHVQHMLSSMVIYRWLSACLRWCAQMSCPAAIRTPLSARALETLFDHLSTIHAVIQILQYHLVNQDGAPHATCLAPSPDGDTAEHIHLRWLTRLDRETDDATWLIFSIVSERLVREESEVEDGDHMQGEVIKSEDRRLDIGWLQACESRVRKGFKLAAFYFNFFTISPDPHQTHHLAFSLELIPNWTFLATQRFIPIDPKVQQTPYYSGLRSKADELTETELDWIERGLELAQKYHPVAERRLVEMRSYRLAEKRRLELLAADGVPVPVSRARALPPPRLGQKSALSFQDAMKRALTQTVPSWA
ncbi:hypothetical protein JCM8115_003496 [Rhodotorula mucilaginosa]